MSKYALPVCSWCNSFDTYQTYCSPKQHSSNCDAVFYDHWHHTCRTCKHEWVEIPTIEE